MHIVPLSTIFAMPSTTISPPVLPHHHLYPTGAIVALALGVAPTLIVAVALEVALALALACAESPSFPIPFSTPLFISTMTAMTPPAMRAASRIQKSQQMRVRRFFLDCWRASQDSLGGGKRC